MVMDLTGKTFRFDDVFGESDYMRDAHISNLFTGAGAKVIWATSIAYHDSQESIERIFPKIWNAHSDPFIHYTLNEARSRLIRPSEVAAASHGLVHVDHRLIHKEAQRLSIVLSCSLVGAKMFVPPFNKWNSDTEEVCKEHGIELVKFEDGWLSMEYNDFDPAHELYYLHAREWTLDKVKEWLKQ